MDKVETASRETEKRSIYPILGVLLAGIALWLVDYQIWENSRNVVLLAPLLTLGAFLIPACLAYWFYLRIGFEQEGKRHLLAFILGGIVALNLSVAIGVRFIKLDSIPLTGIVAVSEEFTKALVAITVAGWGAWRSLNTRTAITVGAAVGYGFAAFETFGYALTNIYRGGAASEIVQELVIRGALSPFGHGLWTATLTGLIVAVWKKRTTATAKVGMTVGMFALIAGIHFLWNSAGSIGVVITGHLLRGGVTLNEIESAWLANETVTEQRSVLAIMAVSYILLTVLCVALIRRTLANQLEAKPQLHH